MAGGVEKKSNDFYGVLGLEKECTQVELKNVYKKLAMRWHPDRFSSSGNSKFVEDAKKKFQGIQAAYDVLSDETKRFLYDVGVYDDDDDENNQGMGEFLNEMATMMCENKPAENGEESFEELQELFEELFNGEEVPSTSQGTAPCSTASFGSTESSCINNKRSCSEMDDLEVSPFNPHLQCFRVGAECREDPREKREANRRGEKGASSWRQGRKRKVSYAHDVSCDYPGIST